MEKDDGALWMTMRTRKGVMYQTTSLDGGYTWSISEKYTMPNANTRFYIGKMSDGTWYMVYNNSSTVRTKMTMAISSDEGKTWENKLCLYGSYCSYPDAAIIDGNIHVVFDDGRYKQYQWRTDEDGKIKTWGHIYHYSISETELKNMSYTVLDVEELDIVARCKEYTSAYLEGTGTQEDPYLITDKQAWKIVASMLENEGENFEGKYLKVTNDFTIAGNIKLGTSKTYFAGNFDGDGHTITYNMSFSSGEANQGLFGQTAGTSVIKNLKVAGTMNTERTTDANIGCIVGVNRGVVQNCESSVVVTAKGYKIGGIVGTSVGGSILDCTFNGSITSTSTATGNTDHGIGGIVGYINPDKVSVVDNCINEGSITTGSTQVGGIVGLSKGANAVRHQISECINKGNIISTASVNSTTNEGVAGIIGMAIYTNVTNCENSGNITAKSSSQVAGIVGKCCEYSTITNCVNKGTIIGLNQVGGISGRHVGNVSAIDCENQGDVYYVYTNKININKGSLSFIND